MGRSCTLEPTPTRRQCGGKPKSTSARHTQHGRTGQDCDALIHRSSGAVWTAVSGCSALFGATPDCSALLSAIQDGVGAAKERERGRETRKRKEKKDAVQCFSVRFGAVRCCLRLSGAVGACSGGYSILSGAVRCRSALREREGARDREELVTRQRPSAPERAMRPPGEGGAGDC